MFNVQDKEEVPTTYMVVGITTSALTGEVLFLMYDSESETWEYKSANDYEPVPEVE